MRDAIPEREYELLLELYRTARETRAFEIELFWKRSNYFLVLNTALAVGFLSRHDGDRYAIAISLIGAVVACLWVRVNLGSKYWQSRWEHRLRVVENQLDRNARLFSAGWKVLDRDVSRSLRHSRKVGRLTQFYNRRVQKKPSVSKSMTLLSVFFVLIWLIALAYSVTALLTSRY